MLIFVMVFLSMFGRRLFNNVSFLFYILTLTLSVNDIAELPATLDSQIELYIYIYI